MYQRPGYAETLFHPAGKRIHKNLLFIGKIHQFQQIIGDFFDLPGMHAVHGTVKVHILLYLQIIIHPEKIRHIADLLFDILPVRQRIHAIDPDIAGGWQHQPAHHAYRGRLSGAVWPNKAEQIPLRDMERQIPDCLKFTIILI